jgi:hypothetical protein
MRKPGSFVAALCVAALAVACQEQPTTDPFEGFVCTLSVEPAIVVRLVNGETGMEGLPGFALMAPQFGTVRDGGYVDSLRLSSFSEDTLHSVWAAPERPGRYDVLVRIGGYSDWLALGVTVEGGVCHVQTVELRAVLLPA